MEAVKSLTHELKHSNLIIAADIRSDGMNFPSIELDGEDFGLLFTDMVEFYKVFQNNEYEAHDIVFEFFKQILDKSDLKGYVINIASEAFIIWDELIDLFGDMPEFSFSSKDSYSTAELRQLKESVDNAKLEEFLKNPQNVGKYEELFDRISESALFILRLTKDDFNDKLEDGIINLEDIGPVGYLYIDRFYGNYAPIYTSEAKMSGVNTELNKYSQLVNFSQMINSVLSDDMDGIIINPNSDNVILTRDVLMEFSPVLEKICNNSKLNSGIYHMFSIEEV